MYSRWVISFGDQRLISTARRRSKALKYTVLPEAKLREVQLPLASASGSTIKFIVIFLKTNLEGIINKGGAGIAQSV
jgi:hypothetical protein